MCSFMYRIEYKGFHVVSWQAIYCNVPEAIGGMLSQCALGPLWPPQRYQTGYDCSARLAQAAQAPAA